MTQVNEAFVSRLQGSQQVEEPEPVPEIREYHYVTLPIRDANWKPKGPRTKHPNGGRNLSCPVACRLALSLNRKRMEKQKQSDRFGYDGVQVWTVVCRGAGCYILDIPTRVGMGSRTPWFPESPFDLPPSVKSIRFKSSEFMPWIKELNLQQFNRHKNRCWTVRVFEIERSQQNLDHLANDTRKRFANDVQQSAPKPESHPKTEIAILRRSAL